MARPPWSYLGATFLGTMWAWLTGSSGRSKTPNQMMQECQEDLGVAKRQMQRAIQDLEREDRRLLQAAKQKVREGKPKEARQSAKQITRYRGAVRRMNLMIGRMNEVSINIKLMTSTHAMQQAMVGVTRAMVRINKKFSTPQMMKIMKTFEKESYKMELSQEMMDGMMDETMAQFDDEDAENELVNQVMDEIGLAVDEQLTRAPQTTHGANGDTDTSALLSRLDRLRSKDNEHKPK